MNQAELFRIPWTFPALSKWKHCLSFPLCEIRILLLLWQESWSEYLNHAQHFYTPPLQIINKYISITQNCVLFFPLPIQTFKIHEDSRGGNGGRRRNQIFRPLDLTIFPVYNNWDLSCFKEKKKAHSVLNLLWWNGICIQHPSPVVRGNHCLHRRLCTLNPLLVQLLYIWF